MKRLACVVGVVLVVSLAGCESAQRTDASLTMINSSCPFSGNAIDREVQAAEWEGGNVGFCCAGCAKGWEDLSDEARRAKLASLAAD